MSEREHLKFRWSHNAWVHRAAIRTYNRVAKHVPFGVKYGVGKQIRRGDLPYSLVAGCRTVVQVGAPRDTLLAGRSRAMYFALLALPAHQVVVVEPDPHSVEELQRLAAERGIQNLTVIQKGAWNQKDTMTLFVSDAHPASNFVEGTADFGPERMRDYRRVEVPVDRLDHILKEHGIPAPDLISVTANGAERQIIEGMSETIDAGLPYVCLARTGEGYVEWMESLGYEMIGYDDRGYTFEAKR